MKFYLDDKLVRTSKTHVYTCALVTESGSVLSCHGSFEQALKAKNQLLAKIRQNRENVEAAIRAIDAGQTTYWCRYGRDTWKAKVTEPREYYADYVAELTAHEARGAGLDIRKLETR